MSYQIGRSIFNLGGLSERETSGRERRLQTPYSESQFSEGGISEDGVQAQRPG